jgi:hypothetical protein
MLSKWELRTMCPELAIVTRPSQFSKDVQTMYFMKYVRQCHISLVIMIMRMSRNMIRLRIGPILFGQLAKPSYFRGSDCYTVRIGKTIPGVVNL